MRVLYHHRTTAGDAQGIHIREIVRCFRQLDHEVKEVSLVESEGETRSQTGWRALSIKTGWPRDFMNLMYNPVGYHLLARAIREFQPDFIYERYALHCMAGVMASRRHRLPLILEVNSPLAKEESALGRVGSRALAERSETWTAKRASRVVCVSGVLKKILVEQGVAADHIEVCANGVDPERFHGRDTAAGVRARYGLGTDKVLGFVGWLRDWHGLSHLVESMSSLEQAGHRVHLLVVGDGPAREGIERAAVRAGIGSRVHITGPLSQDDVVDHIAAFDIALQPAVTEYASPMKIFEYLAMGKPIVAPRQENITEILTDGLDARLFRPGDFNDLLRAATDLLSDPDGCGAMGRAARATIFKRQFLWSSNAARMIELAREEMGT